jgi:hypothetical protein
VPRGELAFDGEPELDRRRCADCGADEETSTGFVLRDGSAFAAYWLTWSPHGNEGRLDAVLGTWEEPGYPAQATFGCRIGAVDGQDAPACSLVPAAARRSDAAFFGTRLDPEAARRHPWLGDFWALTDWVVLNDPLAHERLYHFGAS